MDAEPIYLYNNESGYNWYFREGRGDRDNTIGWGASYVYSY